MATWLIVLGAILLLLLFGVFIYYMVYTPCVRNRVKTQLIALGPSLLYPGKVDLQRYAGKWYEIARLPNEFERGCVCSTATYSVRDDGSVSVLNQCRKVDEPVSNQHAVESVTQTRASGVARAINATNTALRVSFAPQWLGDAAAGDYWILDVDDDYQSALVGSPDRRYLWVLARSPDFANKQQFRSLIDQASAKGYDTSKLTASRCTMFD